ncbi:RES family NAD+ phosphorylase [Bradyrhizobium sp. UFLA05-112]
MTDSTSFNALDDEHSDTYGPAWFGWERYNQFVKSVKSEMRYVWSKDTNAFLDEVLATSASRKQIIRKGFIGLWRAQIGCDSEEMSQTDGTITAVYDEDRPFTAARMKPIPNWFSEGRVNPRGIPYLYLATDSNTALAEVRPWIGATISVAQFKTNRDLNVIDCSKHHAKSAFIKILTDKNLTREDGIWTAIDQAFATPVSREVESRDYVATQILTELFKSSGYDGIVYKSLLTPHGFNVALFNLDDADVINCGLHSLNSISFDFKDIGPQYFIKPKK